MSRVIAVTLLAAAAVTPSPAHAQDRPLDADFAEVYRVGGSDLSSGLRFLAGGPLAFDESGSLYVLHPTSGVSIVGPAGQLVRTVPTTEADQSRFDFAAGMLVWRDGRFGVMYPTRNTFRVFGPDGEFERSLKLSDRSGPLAGIAEIREPVRMDPGSGAAFGQRMPTPVEGIYGRLGLMGSEDRTDGRAIERLDLDGEVLAAELVVQAWRAPREEPSIELSFDELLSDPARIASLSASLSDDLEMFFEPGLYWDVLPGGAIAYSDSSAYAIRIAGADGSVREVLRRPIEPEPVDDRIRSAHVEREIAEANRRWEGFNEGSRDIMREYYDAIRARIPEVEVYPEVPVIRGLRATWQGALWVQRRGEEPWDDDGPIDVFGPDRRYIGTFAVGDTMMPAAFGPDGLAAFWETDESDAPTIVVRRLTAEVR
ncbi:MAG: hypothetical protein F4087_09470 [Gemmatimonadetes bacterium]|nr:hypothetical protein [Gemmatimonadota bacterium]MYE69190.1 hypothetical protein [Gemmatimonadota bacterium]MYJ68720.1 hypothetical protein [Gemmatimonadota bacterium]